jgi:serine/threonine protein kinase
MEDKGDSHVCPQCGWKEGKAPESPTQLQPRTILNDQYLLGRVLGQGDFGITYLAWDMNLERKIAIKEYFPSPLATRRANQSTISIYSDRRKEVFSYGLSRFLEEGKTLAKFREHPGIVSVIAFFKANDTGYLVMEYVDGITLKEYLDRNGGKVPIETALEILMPVMDALREIHGTGLLHRDISPDNIYITEKGKTKLLDFGAERYETGEYSKSLSVILKDGYAPEEQYRSGGEQGPWTDLYALAATFYRSITGKVPPRALDRLVVDDLPPPSRLQIKIPAAAETALMKALAVKADDRFKTVEEFQAAIVNAESQHDYLKMEKTGEPGYSKMEVIGCSKCFTSNEVLLDSPLEKVYCKKCGNLLDLPKKEPVPVQKKESIELDLSSPRILRCPGCLASNEVRLNEPLEEVYCKNCGDLLKVAAEKRLKDEQDEAATGYKGVQGSLLVFCISLTTMAPIAALYNLGIMYSSFEKSSSAASKYESLLAIDALGALGMMIFSIAAGILLRRKRKNAVVVAKRFLITLLIFGFVESFIVPLFGGLSPTSESVYNMLLILIYGSGWYAYLNKSERVKATYGGGE